MQIEEIVKKVLEEIRKLEHFRDDLQKMLIIGEAPLGEKELRGKLEARYDLKFSECFEDHADFDVLLLTEISPDNLQKLAMGMNPKTGPVMEALMRGKKVLYLEEGLQHRKMERTCPRPLYKLYEESVKKINSFGIHPYESREGRTLETASREAPKKRGLIGEKEIQKMVENGERILYMEGTPLITPLAKDLMRNYGITVERREGRK